MWRGLILSAVLLCAGAGTRVEAQRIRLPVPVKQLEAAVAKDPNDAIARYNLALGYWSEKKYDRAEAELREATALEPRFALAYLAQSMLPFARRDELWNESLEGRVPVEWRERMIDSDRLYRTAFMMNPLMELRILGAVSPKKSVLWEMDSGLSSLYNEWLRGFDDFRDAEYSGAYLRLDRLARDMTVGRQNVKNLPFGLLWYRGLAAAQVYKYEESIRDLSELLARSEAEEDPSQLTYMPLETNTYRYVLAAVLRRANRTDEAMALYNRVLELDAGAYLAHVALAEILDSRGDQMGALAQRQAAAAANPEDFTSEVELAVVLARVGRTAEAREALERAALAQPRSPRPWYLLGVLLQATGREAEARTAFERFLDVAPGRFASEISDARRRLGQGGG